MCRQIGLIICLAGVLDAGPLAARPAAPVASGPGGSARGEPAPPAPAGPATPTASAAPKADVPARNANVYNGTAHEPAVGPTIQREQAAGVAGSQETQRRETNIVEQLNRQVQRNAGQPSSVVRNCPPNVTYCPP
jgi:hypothetical protein